MRTKKMLHRSGPGIGQNGTNGQKKNVYQTQVNQWTGVKSSNSQKAEKPKKGKPERKNTQANTCS